VPGGQGVQIGDRPVQVDQYFAPPPVPAPEVAAGLVVVGEIPRELPGWQARPDLVAAVEGRAQG